MKAVGPLLCRGEGKVCRKQRILVRSCKECSGNYKHLWMIGTWYVKERAEVWRGRLEPDVWGSCKLCWSNFTVGWRGCGAVWRVLCIEVTQVIFLTKLSCQNPALHLWCVASKAQSMWHPPSLVSAHRSHLHIEELLRAITTQRPGLTFILWGQAAPHHSN